MNEAHDWVHSQRLIKNGQQVFIAICATHCDSIEITTDIGERAVINPHGLIEIVERSNVDRPARPERTCGVCGAPRSSGNVPCYNCRDGMSARLT